MKSLGGRTAVVTGAASGIGLGIARRLAEQGARIALLDIEAEALDDALEQVRKRGEGISVPVDVSDSTAMQAAAIDVRQALGPVHVLVNNAGVIYNRVPLWETDDADIQWSFAVNVFGVINGVKAFVPAMLAHGEEGHIINTSSIGGFQVREHPGWHQGLYAATKYAVVALSEGLRQDLSPHGIGVSILAPASVATRIGTSDRNRPERFGGRGQGGQRPEVSALLEERGISPAVVGDRVVRAILANEPYVFTHTADRALIEARHQAIMEAFDIAEAAGGSTERPL